MSESLEPRRPIIVRPDEVMPGVDLSKNPNLVERRSQVARLVLEDEQIAHRAYVHDNTSGWSEVFGRGTPDIKSAYWLKFSTKIIGVGRVLGPRHPYAARLVGERYDLVTSQLVATEAGPQQVTTLVGNAGKAIAHQPFLYHAFGPEEQMTELVAAMQEDEGVLHTVMLTGLDSGVFRSLAPMDSSVEFTAMQDTQREHLLAHLGCMQPAGMSLLPPV